MTRTAKRIAAPILALLLGFVLFLQPLPTRAATASELQAARDEYNALKERAKEIDNRLKEVAAGISTTQENAAAREAERLILQEQIDIQQQLVDAKQREITLQEASILKKQEEILQKQREYDDNYQLFTERLVAIYKMNNTSVMSTVLTVTSYSEALGIYNALQTISQHDTDMLDTLEAMRLDLEEQERGLQQELADLEDSRTELQQVLDGLSDSSQRLGQQIADDYARIAAYEYEQQQLAEEQEKVDAEMEEMWKTIAASTGAYVGGDLTWPVPTHNGDQYLSSYYGWRTLYGRANFHTGLDIARGPTSSISGASIVAANDGEVVLVSTNNAVSGYGYYLILDHGGGIRTLYAHCNTINVNVGDYVAEGTPIATVGNTGNSTGPHLHFEIRINNTQAVDPYPYLTGQKSLS